MSKSQKPRKQYDPIKATRRKSAKETEVVKRLIRASEAREIQDGDLTRLAIAYHGAFATLRLVGGFDAYNDVAAACLIAEHFASVGIGAEYAYEIHAALVALKRVQQRSLKTGSWILDGDAINAVGRALEIHDAQMKVASYGELREGVIEAARKNDESWQMPADVGAAELRRAA